MRRLAALALILAFLALPAGAAVPGVHAAPAADLAVQDQPPAVRFPDGITFRAFIQSSAPVAEAILHYQIRPDSPPTYVRASLEGSSAEHVLEGNAPPRIYLWPGATVEYWWEVRDTAGAVQETPRSTVVYQDTRFQWQRATANGLEVWYYGNAAATAEQFLQIGAQTMEEIGRGLLEAVPDFPVKVFVYASREDMLPALQRRGETYESQVITLGVRVSSDTVLVLNQGGADDTLRHELTHVLTKVAGVGVFGDLPAWLDEGTAVYAQRELDGYYGDALRDAVRRNTALSLASMNVPPGDPAKVGLFYGQAGDVVRYLVEEEPDGRAKFRALFAALKDGRSVNEALEETYGFDLLELEARWREDVGLPPRGAANGGEETAGRPGQTGDAGGSAIDDTAVLAGGIIALSVLAAGGILGGTLYLTRRRI
ncbi:MAG TPA: peptidase MA family metallohydrolase [Natronosporangium sp.]